MLISSVFYIYRFLNPASYAVALDKNKKLTMLYLEDFLECIEHLPQDLRDRFTEMRESDLKGKHQLYVGLPDNTFF